MSEPPYAIFLNGSYGVGKSATLDHVGHLLAAAGTPFSLMDVDWFHRSWPPPEHDPRNVLLEAENLAAVWARYRQVGPRQLVVSGVARDVADRRRYESAFELPVRSVRLAAGVAVTEARLRHRYGGEADEALSWHLERHAALARQLEAAGLDELVVATDELTPRAVAQQVLTHFGV